MKFKDLTKKEQRYIYAIGIVTLFLFTTLTVMDFFPTYTVLKRNTHGGGNRKENLRVSVGEKVKDEPITVVVEEQGYTEEQIKKVFDQSCKDLDRLILGDNQSLDEVHSDLTLITSMPDQPIDIVWEVSDYNTINVKGELVEKNLKEEGTLVELRGTLTYKEFKMQYVTNANIFPPNMTGIEKVIAQVQQQVKKTNQNSIWEKHLVLPKSLGKQPLVWRRNHEGRSFYILLVGIILMGLIFAKHKQDIQELQQRKEKQMMLDYPEIINRFVLLIGAGMTVKNAWRKIVTDYQSQHKESRHAYEEMAYTYREMQSGVTEGESYERFGRRCKLQPYLKFGALLSQNLRMGTKGLTELLMMESIQAFEERKALAKRLGEEASTKLLMPMFLMLAIVLVIVIVPAFLSMQM